jgi:hypothetical protein
MQNIHRPAQAELRRGEAATWGSQHPDPAPAPRRLKLFEWRPLQKGTLPGFATVELPIGLTIKECPVFVSGDREWVNLPAKPQIDREGNQRTDINGKAQYVSILEWRDRDLRDRFSEAVISGIRESGHRLGGGEQ